MVRKLQKGLFITALIILIPYVTTLILTGRENITERKTTEPEYFVICTGEREGDIRLDAEEYLIGAVAAYMPASYEDESYKAMAVVLRTVIRKAMEGNQEIDETALGTERMTIDNMQKAWGDSFSENYKRYQRAVDATEGEVITYQGELADAYFHRISAGVTNTWEGCAYLCSVPSKPDLRADRAMSFLSFELTDFWEKAKENWQLDWPEDMDFTAEMLMEQIQLNEGTAPYIQNVKILDKEIKAEEFRQAYSLSSTAFTIEEYNGKIRIITKGNGHGYGMSLYGANEMALEGKNYKSILETYYTKIEVEHE